jgi:putative iron-regulated protein
MKAAFKLSLCLFVAACGGGDDDGLDDAPAVIENYATVVHTSYEESLAKADELKLAIDALVANPDAVKLSAAQDAWLAAREPYGQTEGYRFYDGPIDDPEDGPEGRINAWPLDEAYIDYVEGNADAGIINDLVGFPTLTKDIIAEQNEKDAEENISTGYHAIEFLLWGQDFDTAGPGQRPFTDYLTVGGTSQNQDRRGQYLTIVTDLLIEDLEFVEEQWEPGATNYGSDFQTVDSREALRRILQGMGAMSGSELSGERMGTALDNRDQEDEHSCFSDNTHRDLRGNAISLQNIYLGKFGGVDGPGLDEIVAARDPDLDARMKAALQLSVDLIEGIPTPFDQALVDDADGRVQVEAAIDALKAQTDVTVEIATLLGITINLE